MLRIADGQQGLELSRGAVTLIRVMSFQFTPTQLNSIQQTLTGPLCVLGIRFVLVTHPKAAHYLELWTGVEAQ